MKAIGILLIALGLVMLIYKGINFTTKEKVVDLGPVEINKEEKHAVPLSPIVGGLALVGGIFLVGYSSKKNGI